MTATPSFREALSEGIASGTLVDTKVVLFSRKNSSGRVYGPKALYANSLVLKSIPYFDHLLFGNFIEAESRDFNEVLDGDETSSDYDYDSDSDLEDDGQTALGAFKDVLKKVVPSEEVVKETLKRIIPPNDSLKRGLRVNSLPCLRRGTLEKPAHEDFSERPDRGKVVKIPDVAFITFQAFLLYLYTGEIEFAPIKPRGALNWRIELCGPSHDDIQRPSPRSIYRLADKYDVPALKNLALSRIRLELQNRDIVEETFSKFASKYDEIRSEYVTQLLSAMVNDTRQAISPRVSAIIDRHSRGDLEHVGDALSLLWNAANQRGAVVPPSIANQAPWQAPPVQNPTNWKALKIAMVKSIKQGVFFDKKYWVRSSRDGRALKPIYFSSLIAGRTLRNCIMHSSSQDRATTPPAGEIGVESDCESDSMEAGQDQVQDGRIRTILTRGSFAAWRSLLFYLCTDSISFAPLKSQGAEFRLAYIQSVSGTPPPCSPKSIYTLARSLNLQPLCELSFEDIESKLSADNIVEELSSHVSSAYKEVREMECRLFFSRFQNPATIRRMEERFASVGRSRSAHQADALKLGLQSAIDIKKRNSLDVRNSAMLRCRESDCPGNKSYASYYVKSFANKFCQPCLNIGRERFLVCTSCGYERNGRHRSCRGCEKKFVLIASSPH